MNQNLEYFIKGLKKNYWTKGSVWEFDWYIGVFFAEVETWGKYPVKIDYEQPVVGDEFLEFSKKDEILEKYKNFFKKPDSVHLLLRKQKSILRSADELLKQIRLGKFEPLIYESVQKHLSLLMASVSVIFDELMNSVVAEISFREKLNLSDLVNFIIDRSSNTKLNESNSFLLRLYSSRSKEFEKAKFVMSNLSKDSIAQLENHSQIYGWLNTGQRSNYPWVVEDFLTQLKNLVGKTRKEKQKTLNLQNFRENHKQLVRFLIEINLNDNIAADKQVELDYLFQKYLKEKLQDYYIDEITDFLTFGELMELLGRPSAIKKYENRKMNIKRAVWPRDGKLNFHYFEEAKEFEKVRSFIQSPIFKFRKIVGTVACRGKAEGNVHIVRGLESLKTFKEGFILVAEQTQPAYVLVMAKAKAIVTDVGGITSHAAIVSREFGIPCIVGTKIATKVLKDGDLVEVDAEKGIVRKLETGH